MFDFDKDYFFSLSREEQKEYLKLQRPDVQEILFVLCFAASTISLLFFSKLTSTEPFLILLVPFLLFGAHKFSRKFSLKAEQWLDKHFYDPMFDIESERGSSPPFYKRMLEDLRKPPNLASIGLLIAFSLFLCGILTSLNKF